MKDFMKMVKQAQQVQTKMAGLEDELSREEFEASSGGGAVTVRVNGKQEVVSLSIGEAVVREGDREMLEELILAALNAAHRKAAEFTKERIASITGGMNVPGLF
jgi:hypothetical protein